MGWSFELGSWEVGELGLTTEYTEYTESGEVGEWGKLKVVSDFGESE